MRKDKRYVERIMKKKFFFITISAAVILIMASLSSTIGINYLTSTQKFASPLFTKRIQQSIQKENQQIIHSDYLGKGFLSNIFITTKPSLSTAIDRTIKLLYQTPIFFTKLIKAISSNPQVISLLQENGIRMTEFQTHISHIKNNPSAFIDEIQNIESKLNINNFEAPLPLNLNTSSVIGCVITAIVMIPVALIITLIVIFFTLRILQCLNIEEILNNIFDQILQQLIPPKYNI